MEYVLTDKELLQVLKHGIWAKLTEDDTDWTHYNVLDFDHTRLLVCYSCIDWRTGETWYKPHIVLQDGKDKTWFMEKPKEQ